MDSIRASRRGFLAAGATTALAAQQRPSKLTAQDVVDRIKANVGVPWRAQTVDNIVAGSPTTPVSGIATTMMSTFDVIKRAVAQGSNFVITHEPTFYLHQDTTDQIANDPTYLAKAEFIAKNNVAVFRFHDHWHARRPDGIATGMAMELGWEKYADAANPRKFEFPATTLGRLAGEIQEKLKIRTMRVIGDPNLAVKNVRASWGFASYMPSISVLAAADVDVLIVGETREWELVEYAQDAITAGKSKALIVMGHVVSEQAGMKYCASWLKPFIPEVPVGFVPAAEPFWAPGKPTA